MRKGCGVESGEGGVVAGGGLGVGEWGVRSWRRCQEAGLSEIASFFLHEDPFIFQVQEGETTPYSSSPQVIHHGRLA